MNSYILDTDSLIDFSKGREPVVSLVNQWIVNGDRIGVCAINIAEFYSGLPHTERKNWDEFFESLIYFTISREEAKTAGIMRYEFQKKGKVITTTDALIAAVAKEQDVRIVTSNIDDFPVSENFILSPRN